VPCALLWSTITATFACAQCRQLQFMQCLSFQTVHVMHVFDSKRLQL